MSAGLQVGTLRRRKQEQQPKRLLMLKENTEKQEGAETTDKELE